MFGRRGELKLLFRSDAEITVMPDEPARCHWPRSLWFAADRTIAMQPQDSRQKPDEAVGVEAYRHRERARSHVETLVTVPISYWPTRARSFGCDAVNAAVVAPSEQMVTCESKLSGQGVRVSVDEQ